MKARFGGLFVCNFYFGVELWNPPKSPFDKGDFFSLPYQSLPRQFLSREETLVPIFGMRLGITINLFNNYSPFLGETLIPPLRNEEEGCLINSPQS
jgi:hypothetical protein